MMQLFLDEQHAVANPDRILLVSSAFATQDDEHVGKNQGIVYEFDGKVGSTMHLLNRRKDYALLFLGEASQWHKIKLNILCRMDKAMDQETDKCAKVIVGSFLQAVMGLFLLASGDGQPNTSKANSGLLFRDSSPSWRQAGLERPALAPVN